MDGFSKLYRFDRNKQRGTVMVHIRDIIPSKISEKIVAQMILNVFL